MSDFRKEETLLSKMDSSLLKSVLRQINASLKVFETLDLLLPNKKMRNIIYLSEIVPQIQKLKRQNQQKAVQFTLISNVKAHKI